MDARADTEKYKHFIIRFAYWLIIAGIVYCLITYLLPLLMPFVIGWAVAAMLKPLSEWASKASKLSYKWASIIILFLFYVALIAVIVLSGYKLVEVLSDLILAIPDYYVNTVVPGFWQIVDSLTKLLESLDPSAREVVEDISGDAISWLTNLVTSFSTAAFNWVTGFAGALPLFLVNFLVVLISSFYIAADYPLIKSFLKKQVKPEIQRVIILVKDNAMRVVGKFVKAYLLLMSLNFVEMLIGMYIIGVGNPVLISLGIAIFDVLPVLGTGGILVPWAIIDLIMGNVTRAMQVLVLYAVVTVIRNFLEPKVVGQQIGLHPLLTLILMYVGALLFGLGGFLLLPVTGVIIKDLNDSGSIKLIKK